MPIPICAPYTKVENILSRMHKCGYDFITVRSVVLTTYYISDPKKSKHFFEKSSL